MATWPVSEAPPDGWQRSEYTLPLIWRIATGGPEDEAVTIDGYTESADCGISNVRLAGGKVATTRGV